MGSTFFALFVAFAAGNELFPTDYSHSRTRFEAQCLVLRAKISAHCGQFRVPSPHQTNLFVSYGEFKRNNNKKLLVLVSGVHGPEAYTGSAIQELVFRKFLGPLVESGTDVVMVHAMNPYGFKVGRRVTENNVNLNRNFGLSNDVFHSVNESYRSLQNLLEPAGPVTSRLFPSLWTSARFIGKLALGKFNTKPLIEAVGRGQYNSKLGLEFGGQDFEPQVKFAKDLFQPLLKRYEKAVFLDLHTGLGEKKTLHLIFGQDPHFAAVEKAKLLFTFPQSAQIILTSVQDRGFYRTKGDLIDFIASLAPEKARDLIIFTTEFGTVGNGVYPKLQTVNRMILENQGFQFGFKSVELKREIQDSFKELFFPSDESWQDSVIEKAGKILSAILTKF